MLGRTLVVLDAFAQGERAVSLAELSRRTGLPKSTLHRLAGEMVEHRLLERTGGGYGLGGRLFEIGERVPAYRTLADAAQPVMHDLREATHHRIHLAVLDGTEVVYIAIIGPAMRELRSRVGGRLPAHATGVGKVMLAYSGRRAVQARVEAGLPPLTPRTITTPGMLDRELRKIRTVGMALDLEENAVGMSCVAAPVWGADRRIRAALSVTGPTRSIDPSVLGPAVRTAAFTLSRTLRDSGL